MKFVLDPSVALKWCLPEAHVDEALRLREDFLSGVHELIAPDVFSIEVGHALSKAHRQRKISIDEAESHFDDVMSTAPQLSSSLLLLGRAYEISLSSQASLYDCLYLALAEEQGCRVVTADQRLTRNQQVAALTIHLSQL